MKKFLFICFALLALNATVCPNANAEITVKDYMSYEFLNTQGYSPDMLRLVEINKAKTFGETLPNYWPSNPIKRAIRKFTAYIDPAEDYGDFGMHKIYMRSTTRDY